MSIVYGDNQLFEDARIGLYDQMVALMNAMVGDDPKPAAIYDNHQILNPEYPSISVDVQLIENEEEEHTSLDVSALQDYQFNAEIRIHMEYEEREFDEIACLRLLNSINNWIETHRTALGDYIKIENAEVGVTFPESLTIGGKINLIIRKITTHTQA